MNDLLDRFNPSFTTKCSIKSLLTFVVQIIFSEMRIDATGMLLQLEFDYRFSRTVKEWMCYSICLRHSSQVPTTDQWQGFIQVARPPKERKLYEGRVNEMRNWRAMLGQSVPQKTVQNMTTKDNLLPKICMQPALRPYSR